MIFLIVSCDAGGAEIISSWVKQHQQYEYQFVLDGPANNIFSRKISNINISSIDELEELIDSADFLLTGTSQVSELERRAIYLSKKTGTKCATFLDYWYAFRERFILNGELVVPDTIWVGDNYAFTLAKKVLPEAEIILKDNPYLIDMLHEKELIELQSNVGVVTNILYLCQPYKQNYFDKNNEEKQLTDMQALEYFFKRVIDRKIPEIKIRLRQHPLELPDKYQEIIHKYSKQLSVTVIRNQSLAQDLVWAGEVVGMHAQALSIAVAFDKRTFYCIPSDAPTCVLPHKEITAFA